MIMFICKFKPETGIVKYLYLIKTNHCIKFICFLGINPIKSTLFCIIKDPEYISIFCL